MNQKIILDGFKYLNSIQNVDKGIPATKEGDSSGCWTSAETLETILLSPYNDYKYFLFAKDIIKFLLNTQIDKTIDKGSWPLLKGRDRGSAMATGHAVSALSLANDIFKDDVQLSQKISSSINDALIWLNNTQNKDGGWGVEPSDSGNGNLSRVISTVYVLRGYITHGFNYDNNKTVRSAINYIKTLKKDDAGFSGGIGGESDPCYTARAIIALVKTKAYSPQNKYIKESISYIIKNKNNKGIWNLDTEPYIPDNSSGQVVYNSNTVADVLEALSVTGRYNKNARKLESWFMKTQEHDGKWYLGANKRSHVSTWSTNEALYSLICTELYFTNVKYPYIMKLIAWYKKALISLLILLFISLVLPVNIISLSWIINLWDKIPENWQNIILGTIIFGTIVNLFSAYITKYMPWKKKEKV
ncbi:hypothetical protein D0T84_18000 [Dysgonomonas sp. 521]|uniref:prenyltransferase/squalene oxidase repeat-containing protein n=1 Tax=Dysgonomonas sp. 521 TaxID=2302932 RepID=UPI0013D12582|nr:prenyltransferase/squalene oxidase repeat-containing protein [Dysgonomonas sp. 521]NDV96785.1 hypothetical protein [Dysgonomonas sp. 521]